jgi:inner membrane protein
VEVGVLSHVVTHRSWTHSLLVAPILSFFIAGAWAWFRRKRARGNNTHPRAPAFPFPYGCVLVAVLTQPLLDWCTSYGTQLLTPITNHRYALDAVAIVDFLYTPLLILTLLACHRARKRIGSRAGRITLFIGWTGFLLTTGYLVAGWFLHGWAIEKALPKVDTHQVQRIEAYPMIGTILLWRVVVQTPSHWQAIRVHHFADPSAGFRTTEVKRERNDWIQMARSLREAKTFDWFTNGMTRATYAVQNSKHVVGFHDMRYSLASDSTASLWSLRMVFNDAGEPVHLEWVEHHRRRGLVSFLMNLWSEIWNP